MNFITMKEHKVLVQQLLKKVVKADRTLADT